MQIVLGFLVAIGILQIQIGYVCSNSNEYFVEVPPSSFWSFVKNFNENNKEEEEAGDRSAPQLRNYEHERDSVLIPIEAIHRFPQYFEEKEDARILEPHLNNRRSAANTRPKAKPKTAKPKSPKLRTTTKVLPKTTATSIAKETPPPLVPAQSYPVDGYSDEEEPSFLTQYALDIDKVAYNSAKYVQFSWKVILEHIKCLLHIMKLTILHLFLKIKLLFISPLQLLFLPFTLPIDLFRFTVATGKFVLLFVKYLFTSN